MSKILCSVILPGILILLMASCSFGNGNNEANVINTPISTSGVNAVANTPANTSVSSAVTSAGSNPATSAGTVNNAGTANNADAANNADTATIYDAAEQTTATAEEPVDGSITLESVKQAALDAGYAAEDIQDLQLNTDPSPVRGIYVNYKDDSYQSQSPVYEFSNVADAQKFALDTNKEGYCLCIVNGKLVAVTGSKYGVVLYDKEKAVLETLLKSSVMAYEEPLPPPVSSNMDYAGDCTRIDAIVKAIDKLVNKSVLIYAKSLPDGDPGKNITNVTFSMLSSGDMSFTSALCEDLSKMDEVIKAWELYGCTGVKLKRNAANDYTLTGKRAGMDDPFNIHCTYSPDKDSLRIVDIDGKDTVEMLEFVPLGQDRYAFQTLYERGIVGYKEGKITSLIYSVNKHTKGSAYDPNADSIYPEGSGVDDSWVSKAGAGTYEQFITFDGLKLIISAVDFTGKVLKVEIDVN